MQFRTDDEMIELGNYLETARTFFVDLGMKITESIDGVQSVNSDVFSELENECTSPSDMVKVLKKKIIHVVLSSNIDSESYMEVLEKVFKKIKQGAEKYFGETEKIEQYEMGEYVINDYIMLEGRSFDGDRAKRCLIDARLHFFPPRKKLCNQTWSCCNISIKEHTMKLGR